MEFNFQLALDAIPFLLQGTVITVKITAFSVVMGIIIGTFVGMARLAKNPLLRWPANVYVEAIRGTPLLVQLFIIYFAAPEIIQGWTGTKFTIAPFVAAVIAFSINSGAYVAEIVRAGIQSIDKGQMEAARSLGMSHTQAMRYIIMPQTFKRIIPPLGNEFIALLKDSSLVATIGVADLMRNGMVTMSRVYKATEILITVGLFYLIMTLAIGRFVAYTERRLKIGD